MLGCAADRFDCLAMVKPQFEVGRERVPRGGVVRDAALRREVLASVARCGEGLGASVLGFASSGLPGPKGNRETFVWLAEGERGGVEDLERAVLRGRAVRSQLSQTIRVADVVTHRRSEETADAIGELVRQARDAGVTLRVGPEEARKHPALVAEAGVELADHPVAPHADLCITLGGDGTVLSALRDYAGTERARVRDQLRRDGVPHHRRPRGDGRRLPPSARG